MATKVHDALGEVAKTGKFVRTDSQFREIISKNHEEFKPAKGRYHLYVSMACPWANRVVSAIAMKGLQDCFSISITHPTWEKTKPNDPEDPHLGWVFNDSAKADTYKASNPNKEGEVRGPFEAKCTVDKVKGLRTVREIYEDMDSTATKFSVPVLFDTETGKIVNNESSEIVRMVNSEFNTWATNPELDLYPEALRPKIDEVNEWIYHGINNGVYKCGFARTQAAYEDAVVDLAKSLDKVEEILSKNRYLTGSTFTEADLRLYMTLYRYDEVYIVYFKTNVRTLSQMPNINNYMRELSRMRGLGSSMDMHHIKMHYFTSHPVLNPYGIIPVGPGAEANFAQPHDRAEKFPFP